MIRSPAMPLSEDAQVNETSNGLVNKLRQMAGDVSHSFRPGTFNDINSFKQKA